MKTFLPLLLLPACLENQPAGPEPDSNGIPNAPIGEERTDVFQQRVLPPIDLLFVVDNASFDQEQEDLGAAFPVWAHLLAPHDWHIGVITADDETEQGQGRFVGEVLTPMTFEVASAFAEQVDVGNDGTINETFIEPTLKALDPGILAPYNKDFRRPDAELHLIMVSDEDQAAQQAPAAYIQDLRGLSAPAMYIHLMTGGPQGCRSADPSRTLIAVQEGFDGAQGDVCGHQEAFEAFLLEVPSWFPTGLDQFALTATAFDRPRVQLLTADGQISEVIDSEFEPVCDGCYSYIYDPRSSILRILPSPPSGAELHVTYRERR